MNKVCLIEKTTFLRGSVTDNKNKANKIVKKETFLFILRKSNSNKTSSQDNEKKEILDVKS